MVSYNQVTTTPRDILWGQMNQFNNIAITRLQCIGDMLVFLPALKKLRALYPRAKITLIGKHNSGLEIVKDCPYVDEVYQIRPGWAGKIHAIWQFRRRKFDLFIVSPQDQGKVPWAYLGGVKQIAAYPRVLLRDVHKHEKMVSKISFGPEFDPALTETENCLRLVCAAAGVAYVKTQDDLISVFDWFGDEEAIRQKLIDLGVDFSQKLILIAPFAKNHRKQWALANYRQLLQTQYAGPCCQVIVLGGKEDLAKEPELCCTDNMLSLVGKLELRESAWLMKSGSLFVGHDSGPAHLASAVGCPVVVFYLKINALRFRVPATRAVRYELVEADNNLQHLGVDKVMQYCRRILPPIFSSFLICGAMI